MQGPRRVGDGFHDRHVDAEDVLSHRNGLFFWGYAPASIPFSGGLLCVAPPQVRTPAQGSGGNPGLNDCSGTYAFHFSHAYMASKGLAAGTTLNGQFYSRDPFQVPPFQIGLTDAIEFTIEP